MHRLYAAVPALLLAVGAVVPTPLARAEAAAKCSTAAQKKTAACKAAARRRAPSGKANAIDAARWGPLADLTGRIWHAPGVLMTYSWQAPGKTLVATDLVSRSQSTFTLNADGSIEEVATPSEFDNSTAYRATYRVDSDGRLTGTTAAGTWNRSFERGTDQLIAGSTYRDSRPTITALQPLNADEIAQLKEFYATAGQPEAIRKNWGVARHFIGSVWEHKSFGDRDLITYKWLEPGVFMVKATAKVMNDAEQVYKPTYLVIGFDPISRTTTDQYTVAEPGLVRGAAFSDPAGDARWEIVFDGTDHYKDIFYTRKKGQLKKLLTNNFYRIHGTDMESRLAAVIKDETDKGLNLGGGFGDMIAGAMMGAATGYANAGGDIAGAIAGGVGGAVVGKAGGNDALYQQMQQTSARVSAEAAESKARLDETIARAQRQAEEKRKADAAAAEATAAAQRQSAGQRVMAQEQARAEQLRQEREAREAAEKKRVADEAAAAKKRAADEAAAAKARADKARADAEAERNRPVEWIEGMVLCEPRAGSKEWRCTGPLQMNILPLDAPNTIPQLGLACGSSNGIHEVGQVAQYRVFGCGFGIHPTARDYPGNRDVPKDFGVYVSDRRVFHCPVSRDAYCRTP